MRLHEQLREAHAELLESEKHRDEARFREERLALAMGEVAPSQQSSFLACFCRLNRANIVSSISQIVCRMGPVILD